MHTPHTLAVARCACGCDACAAAIPAGLDRTRVRETELGLYLVELAGVPASTACAEALVISVARRLDGEPAGARVTISGGRPRCRCAAPEGLAIRKRGAGRFESPPFSFSSPGWWVLRVTISGEAGRDAVTFNLAVSGAPA